MSVKISSLNTASTINSGDDINIAGNNPLYFSDWGGGWYMQDGTWMRNYAKSLWIGSGVYGTDGGLTIGYGGGAPPSAGAIIAGNVGIGTSSPAYKLQVRPSATFGNSEDGNISIWSSFGGGGTVTNPSTVGGIIFGDENTLNSYQGRIAVIANDPSATTAAHMRFYTNAGGGNGATAERMRIAASGNLLIGTTTDAGYKLDVNGSARVSGLFTIESIYQVSRFVSTNTVLYNTYRANGTDVGYIGNGEGLISGGTATSFGIRAESDLIFAIGNATKFSIANSGAATFSSSVTATSLIKSGGTASQYLMADGSTSTLTNPITGTGTTNYLPKFTGASALGNSIIQDNGSTATIGGALTANGLLNNSYSIGTSSFGIDSVGSTKVANGLLFRFGAISSVTNGFTATLNSSNNGINYSFDYGNVGIGTTSPAKKLHIKGGDDDVLFLDNGGQQYTTQYFANNGTTKSFLGWDNTNSIFTTGTAVAGIYAFLTNNAERMRIASGGNVLIGTTTDAGYKLYVNGTGRFSNDLVAVNGTTDSLYSRITSPGGGTSLGNAPIASAIKIALPADGSFLNTMISFTIHIYNYSAGTSRTIKVGGYSYFDTSWYNTFTYQSGGSQIDDINIRFGTEGGCACVWIGETTTYWHYPNIFITDVQVGHSQSSNLTKGWNVSLVSSFGTVQSTIVAYENITTYTIGSQSVSYATTAGALTSMLISQFTNDSGYITSSALAAYALVGHTHDLGRYSLVAPYNIDGLTTTNFRNTLFGNTSNTWNISTARWNTTPTALPGMNPYGTMLAWSGADTQGFIATDYSGANITVGGGNGNSINWTALLVHSGNIGSQSVASAVTLTSTQGNWSSTGVISNVVGLLAWKNYNNNHVIFDASQGTSPSGGVVDQTNSTNAWAVSFPTLMGWNGVSTYGVRVDSARVADGLASMNISQFTNNSGYITSSALADYLPLAAGISYPLTGTLYGVGASFSSGVTASSLSATSVSSSTGFIATAAGGGLRNDFYDVRFYPSAGNIWNITGATLGGSSFALRFLDAYNAGSGAVKAQIFWSASNVGLFNDQNDWVIKANQGSSFGGTLYGAWIVTGSITASANSVISGAVNSAYGLSVTNTGTTGAGGLYVNIGASATGVPFRVDKNGSALFDLTNAGNATIKGALTISGSNLYINSSAADISSRYNNGTNDYGWLLSTGTGNFSLFDYNSEAVYMQINPTTTSSNFYYANFNINVSNTSGGSITFKAAAAANTWSISKNDTTGLSINKNGVSQLGISATGATTLINTLSVTGGYIEVGAYGLSSSTYSAYIRRNDTSSYGAWDITGGKGGYTGALYNTTNQPHIMFGTTNGFGGLYYQNGSRWVLYYNYTDNCLAVGGTTTLNTYKMYVTGAIYATGAIVANSDGRNKENVEVVENALEKVTNLRGVTYTKKDQDSGKREMGVIAQEVEPHVPEVVHHSKDADVYGVSYGNFAGLFIEAIKEQQVLIKELKAEIEILKNK